MTFEERTGPWNEPGYSDIESAHRVLDEIEIVFLNGDVVRISPRQYGIPGEFRVALAEGEDGLAITVAEGDTEKTISWSQLRASTNPDFAQELRRQDAEESRRLGHRLRALREDRGLSQRDLAALASMSGSQLSKIEKGTSDLRFSTIQTLLRAMGATLNDISGHEALELSQKAIRKRAEAHGVGKDLMERLFACAPRSAVPALLRHAFGWDIRDLATGKVTSPQPAGFVFKTTGRRDVSDSPLVLLARRAAEIMHEHAEMPPFRGVPSDATEVRAQLGGGEIRLGSLLEWVWSRGVAVLPLHGSGGFCAAAWNVGGSPIVVLKEARKSAVFWLFDLAHELGHIAGGHVKSGGVVDAENLGLGEHASGGNDQEEHDANEFALCLLLGDYRSRLDDVRRESRGEYLRFKDAVATVAWKSGMSPGLLGMLAAYELRDIGQPKDRWGSATNLARADGDGRDIVTQEFNSRVDRSRMSEIDTMLIQIAVGPS